MGYRLAIAGTESIRPEETCIHLDRTVWPCGMRARAAVRMWLRGRALACDVPAQAERNLIVVECRLGVQDVGAWARFQRLGPRRQGQPLRESRGRRPATPAWHRFRAAPTSTPGQTVAVGTLMLEGADADITNRGRERRD